MFDHTLRIKCWKGLVCAALFLFLPLNSLAQDDFPLVTDAMLQNPADSDWLMWRRTLDSWGYSPLDQIDRTNVDQIRMVWTRDLEIGTGEITPLAYNGLLYIPQANDVIQAVDAKSGDFIWEYRRDIPADLYEMVGGNARNNRNLAIYENLIINTSDDNFVFALDALTGEMVWETKILTIRSILRRTVQGLSSLTAGLFLAAAVGHGVAPTLASLQRMMPAPVQSYGDGV
jgi:alcohol dehydrogenase (cytochrome c)